MLAQSEPGNFIISPFSVASQLSLLSQATNGATFDELRMGLHLNGDKEVIADQYQRYFELIQKSAGASELMIANKIYVQQEYQLKKDFQEVAVRMFSADVESVNFRNVKETVQLINDFVAEKTKGKISEIVTPATFANGGTAVVLINAIYLKSVWVQPFPKSDPKILANFYSSETEWVKVEFMRNKQKFWIAIVPELDAAALRLDYVNSNFSFIIILPDNRFELSRLETQFSHTNLSAIIDQMVLTEIEIMIPKFKVESEFLLNDILKKVPI